MPNNYIFCLRWSIKKEERDFNSSKAVKFNFIFIITNNTFFALGNLENANKHQKKMIITSNCAHRLTKINNVLAGTQVDGLLVPVEGAVDFSRNATSPRC